jgi:ketosteroid isomerase-like protein
MHSFFGWALGAAVAGLLAAASPSPAAEGREAASEAVRQAEVAFAATVAANDAEKFAAMIDADAVFVGAEVTRGRAAIVENWKVFFGAERPEFTWRPEIVELSGDGSLGMTRGPWTMKGKGPDGKPIERSGIFNSIWRRQPDGSWKVVFDMGCPGCPACAAGGG